MFLTYNSLQKYSVELLVKMHGRVTWIEKIQTEGELVPRETGFIFP